uniref:Uncharacterized protein n=1 Tax=Ciona intestinalis TaxID=7719 RepID=H2Y0T2_CIOIN
MSPHSSTADAQLPLSLKIASAGMAGCTADLMTFPLDTVKVWLMVQTQSQSTASRSSAGLVRTVINGVKQNGFLSLYGGFAAGLQRQVSFCAVRIGLYDSVKGFYMQLIPTSTNSKQVPQRILAGATTAIMAATMFQPTEVVKIRMQAQTRLPASQRTYTSSVQAYRSIFRHGGIPELWKGLGANATRLSVVNVSELVTYDLVKEFILDHKILNDNPICHFTSAFISGFVTTLVASPVDVVKTRYMNSPLGTYKNPIHCTKTLFMQEGMKAFYKGFVPSYLRLGTWNIVMFVSYEEYKVLAHAYNNQHRVKKINHVAATS